MSTRMLLFSCCTLLLGGLWTVPAAGQVAAKPAAVDQTATAKEAEEKKIPKIADEPKTIDPATLMPEKLAQKATVDFTDSSLREVLDWLRDEQKIVVLIEENAMIAEGISLSEPISDRLNDDPVYLLLNRLQDLQLGWYYENDILYITTSPIVAEHLQTQSINIGDLLDAGYDSDDLAEAIEICIAPDSWESVGGAGVYSVLGDVVFIRQTDAIQRRIRGLLAALRKPGRQTFIYNPPQDLQLQQKLDTSATVNFNDTPLVVAVEQLASDLKVDLRLDKRDLRENRIREREPITLALTDHKLSTVLQAMLLNLKLTWTIENGVLWIASQEKAEESMKTAVYDVRDLCRDSSESDSLHEAITSQAQPDSWNDVGGPGTISFARPGTMVVHAQDSLHRHVLRLLESYRAALRASKVRDRDAVDPNEVITVYYRLHTKVAEGLQQVLPRLVRPDTWRIAGRANLPGEIIFAPSVPEAGGANARATAASTGDDAGEEVAARAVLIIRQTRAAHEQIAKVIRRVRSGDHVNYGDGVGGVGGGGGFGGGGFGGGFFSIPPNASANQPPNSSSAN